MSATRSYGVTRDACDREWVTLYLGPDMEPMACQQCHRTPRLILTREEGVGPARREIILCLYCWSEIHPL